MAPPRIDVIVNPSHQFQPEFRPMLQQQRRLTNNNNNIKRSTNNHSVVSSSTSPGPSNRMTPPPPPLPSSRHNPAIVMGPPPPPPPPAQPALPKSGANKSPPGQRIRKSTAGTQRRHPASPPDHEEPSSSIPEIGKSNNFWKLCLCNRIRCRNLHLDNFRQTAVERPLQTGLDIFHLGQDRMCGCLNSGFRMTIWFHLVVKK